jgi:hypothetical protein
MPEATILKGDSTAFTLQPTLFRGIPTKTDCSSPYTIDSFTRIRLSECGFNYSESLSF